MIDTLQIYLIVSAILLNMGIFAVITRKNAVAILMGIELILNSCNINFVAFNRFGNFSKSVEISISITDCWNFGKSVEIF